MNNHMHYYPSTAQERFPVILSLLGALLLCTKYVYRIAGTYSKTRKGSSTIVCLFDKYFSSFVNDARMKLRE